MALLLSAPGVDAARAGAGDMRMTGAASTCCRADGGTVKALGTGGGGMENGARSSGGSDSGLCSAGGGGNTARVASVPGRGRVACELVKERG